MDNTSIMVSGCFFIIGAVLLWLCKMLLPVPIEYGYKKDDFQDLVLFHEYFHGDTGRGVGASHQTGWTALIANLIADL